MSLQINFRWRSMFLPIEIRNGFININGHDFSHIEINMSIVTVIIETPRNTAGKYVFDPENQCYTLKKILPPGMCFPYDFGMIENTSADDGDPADAMVITWMCYISGSSVVVLAYWLITGQAKKGWYYNSQRSFFSGARRFGCI